MEIIVKGIGKVTVRVGDSFSSVIRYVELDRRATFEGKLGRSNFLMPLGVNSLVQFDLDGFVSEVLSFPTQREYDEFRKEFKFANKNLEISLHVIERFKDRYDYAKNYSIMGLFNTIHRAVKNSKLGFRTSGGKSIRVYGKHIFVVCDNCVVTMLPYRPEFFIYCEAYARSPIPIPDNLVSKYIGEKADKIYLKFK